MFSNLTSYFWGGGSPAPVGDVEAASATPAVADLVESVATAGDLVIVDGVGKDVPTAAALVEDEDWLMVDGQASAGSEDDKMEEAEANEELHPLRPDTVTVPASVPGMEESWIIAPTPTTLPCLVESAMEVSPLETLLIEHPSMSVYHKLESPVRSLKLSTPPPAVISPSPTLSSKPEAPTIEPSPQVQPSQGSQTKKLVVKKTSTSNQKSKQPAKPPQIPFILRQKAQKHKSVPEPTLTPEAKPKPAGPSPQQRNKSAPAKPDVVVPNKMPKAKSKKVTTASPEKKPAIVPAKQPLGEIQNVASVPALADKPAIVKVSKKPAPAPMNRIVESNIKEMFPTHVYPKDMRPFVEDFQNNVNTRQHRELIAAQRRSQLAITRAKRTARRNPFISAEDEVKTEAAAMMEQKENNVVEMRRQEQFETLLRSSQKQQQKRFDQNLRKNHLSRSNKAIHELSARNKRQRRNDHSNKPSGANNNRKSQ
ncbi:microtubule-associated protein 4 isoform X2 [Diaphorina citri]|uniref:Microtubule-associated protein 4 n=1 Tax=Diaphorina citri TaxID=121845 RepID=A0A1S3D4Z9_DIACI|nr:microtubule-associated protein 4 [Diaphorina citri]XP_008482050.1 microtubule-associated protein 4 isoform X2 [Diaphorina citri]